MTKTRYPLRPFLPADTLALRELFAASVEELTQEDYDEDQRAAWVAFAEDAEAFRERLEEATTIVIDVDREPAGFASLKDDSILDMLYVHPYHAGSGIGSALCDALETLAKARGAADDHGRSLRDGRRILRGARLHGDGAKFGRTLWRVAGHDDNEEDTERRTGGTQRGQR